LLWLSPRFDQNAIAIIDDPTSQLMRLGEPVNEWPKADALNSAANTPSSPLNNCRRDNNRALAWTFIH
jgi:hypothetical protein